MGLFGKSRSNWPTTIAKIDEFGSGVSRYGASTVNASGAFTVNGEFYSVMFEREFRSQTEADACVAFLEANSSVTVRYNPKDPSDNIVDDPSVGGR